MRSSPRMGIQGGFKKMEKDQKIAVICSFGSVGLAIIIAFLILLFRK